MILCLYMSIVIIFIGTGVVKKVNGLMAIPLFSSLDLL